MELGWESGLGLGLELELGLELGSHLGHALLQLGAPAWWKAVR